MSCVRDIIQKGDPILREKAVKVMRFDERLATLLDDMAVTMKEFDGVGLAAPQVGISKRAVIVDYGGEIMEFINPQIVERSGSKKDSEGCLSVPSLRGLVKRANYVLVEAQDRKGTSFAVEAEGLLARILQHEIDHLEGRLFTDIMIEEIKD